MLWLIRTLQYAAQQTGDHLSLNQKRRRKSHWSQRPASPTVWTTILFKKEKKSNHCEVLNFSLMFWFLSLAWCNPKPFLRLCEALAMSDGGHHPRERQEMVEPPQDLLHYRGAWLVWNLHNLYDPPQQWSSGECCHKSNKFRNDDLFMMVLRHSDPAMTSI